MPNPYEIAARRFEQISFLIDPSFTPAERRAVIKERSAETSRATLFRWLKAYREHGYAGLLPSHRADRGSVRKTGTDAWISYAIGLAYEQPDRSVTQLQIYLGLEFPDYALSPSTLRRRMKAHPAYPGLQKLRSGKSKKLRGRFEAKHPHECWQIDGKGRFGVRFGGDRRVEVVVISILDDHSRALLAAQVAPTETAEVAVQVMTKAALKWGLPERIQFDRGSAFDGHVFRNGLAALGLHRNYIEARSPEWDGKIEAYHRSLDRWLVKELKAQEVVDLEHLQEMLEAVLTEVYHRHHHRMIGTDPSTKLAGRVSDRRVSRQDLERAFFLEVEARSDKKTGAVRLPTGTSFVVPSARYAGGRHTFRYHPSHDGRAVLVTKDGREIELQRFEIKPLPAVRLPKTRRGTGQLQKLVDQWRGQERPNAQPGFGVPEVFAMLGDTIGRSVPATEREAQDIVAFYREHGPLLRDPFTHACRRAGERLGQDKALRTYLDELARQIEGDRKKSAETGSASPAGIEEVDP